jgi:hypothetical protein
MTDIQTTLNERGKRYGEFPAHAYITQSIKEVMCDTAQWSELTFDKREALEMIAHKIGRILNGDPEYLDSWVDIVGYAQLVVNQLEKKESAYGTPSLPRGIATGLQAGHGRATAQSHQDMAHQ